MQREIKGKMSNAHLNELPPELVGISYLVASAMPGVTPPDGFVRSLHSRLLDAAITSVEAEKASASHRSWGLRLLVGAAATVSIIGAGLILRRSHILDEISPTIASLLNNGKGTLEGKMANASH